MDATIDKALARAERAKGWSQKTECEMLLIVLADEYKIRSAEADTAENTVSTMDKRIERLEEAIRAHVRNGHDQGGFLANVLFR